MGRPIPAPLLVVTGVPGAGKTTLGSRMAVALGGTFRSLDGIKESLYAGGVQTHNPYGLRLAAEQELVVQLAAAKGTVVVDLWIAPGRDTDRIKALLAPQDKEIVELLCRVPADLAVARYARRTRSGPHRPPDEPTLQRIREATDVLKPIGLGTCIEVDTSRHVWTSTRSSSSCGSRSLATPKPPAERRHLVGRRDPSRLTRPALASSAAAYDERHSMGLLDQITGPRDLRDLDDRQLSDLAAEIRAFLVAKVSRTGGHLGPNLGVIELTMAIHRVFDSPHDRIVFDTGHQAYVHKVLTGRAASFDSLRQQGGLSGYPSQAESEHDIVENSHASTSLSYADGLAKAYVVRGEDRYVVAVVGDGALTGGMCWEALNNIATSPDSKLVIVVNDNGRSYTPTVGGLANHLASLRTDPRYEQILDLIKAKLTRTKLVGPPLYDTLHAVKKGLKDALAPQGMFEDLGLKYVGPVDGHDRAAVEQALSQARSFGGPVIVHAITRKGNGYPPAERHEADNLHSPGGAFDPETGELLASAARIWTDVFRDELVAIGTERSDVVAITAAMLHPTGLDGFAACFPDRTFDVGIAEQHAVTSAAGMAMAGLHPVVAIYATFVNRAFDQVLMDAALHRCGITLVLDRAGVTGDDGPSHNGMWDLSILQVVPGLRIAVPRDGERLRELLREAVDVTDAPTVVRMPRGAVQPDLPAVDSAGSVDVMVRAGERDVLIVAAGPMVATCIDVAARLQAQGIGVTVVDPRWVKPVSPDLVSLARQHRLVASVEDSGRVGGCGSALVQVLADAGVDIPVAVFGIPQRFLAHAKRAVILEEVGLTAQSLAREITARVAALDGAATTASDTPAPDTA